MSLTLDQRVQRNVKMRNKRIRKELPLLAAGDAIPGEWLRTEDQERAHLDKQAQSFKVWWEKFEQSERERAILAERCKAEVHELASEEQFAELERKAKYTDHLSPVYALDFWRRQLSRLDARYCPHAKNNHIYFHSGERCPVCLVIKP